ncbi:COX15/CtaA family protein [Haloarchaeobius iranensis]|uniref:Cytochrome c oxidase assembly protein subunit 15 n=1 Tax=Haloarchaeobius iranensis TaxID=996166 RepID=A0A1G9Z1E1_9EURY|nr:COX15/CtaA family protein [Haloarchaeobius iranensis]SDN15238.1 cytochrome c oxidase assembly protein subunit 15 [Haloarchaeobius iranensis]
MNWLDRRNVAILGAVTTGLTFLLILLGVYTAATGTGLTCQGRWPLCGGPLFGLLPPNVASYPEWIHRFVASITGFFILGTAYGAWKAFDSRRIHAAVAISILVLPVQVLLGRQTVVTYTAGVQTLHHGAAMIIFAALVGATAWMFDRSNESVRKATADSESTARTVDAD